MSKLVTPPKDFITGPFTGHGLQLYRNRLGYMHECMDKYGDFIEFFVGKRFRTLMINSPEAIEWVMLKNAKNYSKDTPGYRKVAEIAGQAVFTDSGDLWKKERALIAPYFKKSKLTGYEDIVKKSCDLLKKRVFESNIENEVNISTLMTEYTLRVVGECLFKEDLGVYAVDIEKELTNLINIANGKINKLINIPTKKSKVENQSFKDSVNKLDEIIKSLIDRSRKKNIDNFVKALDEADFDTSEKFIIDHVKTLAFAGHETSASVLSWCFYFLTKEREWYEKIEIEVLNNQSGDLEDFKNLDLFVKEVLRLRPPAWSFGRKAEEDDVLFDEKVLAGDIITISPYLIHHNKDLYKDPLIFNPNRFSEEEVKKRHRASFIPFGYGPRVCVGADLAVIEIKHAIVAVMKTFRILKSDRIVEMEPLISLRPKGGVYIKLMER